MPDSIKRKLGEIQAALAGDRGRFYAFSAFMIIVFFTGGSSRDDVQSLVLLRPVAALFAGYALTCVARDQLKGRLFPIYIALTLVGLMVLQLIPLSPAVWPSLPGREIFGDIADLAGIEQPWRPLSLSPSRTLNSLFSLIIPISAMMLYLNLEDSRRDQAVAVIMFLALVSALWATFQLAGPSRGSLYLYRITNNGDAVGLFANRNHQAALLAATIVILGWYAASQAPAIRLAALRFYGSIAAIFVLVPLIFITGSRAGLLLMAPALVVAMFLIYSGRFTNERVPSAKNSRRKKQKFASRQIILSCSLIAVGGIAALSIYFARSLAFDRLIGSSEVEGLRAQLLPTLLKMVGDFLPWGTGFGTFEHVYRIYEPQELLRPNYLNQAHNDWLQFLIEGGFAAILIGVAALAWAGLQCVRLAKNWSASRYEKYTVVMAGMVMLLFLAGGVGDYPLRTPTLIAVFAVMACIFGDSVVLVQQKAVRAKI